LVQFLIQTTQIRIMVKLAECVTKVFDRLFEAL
jgi:hypothetical protein